MELKGFYKKFSTENCVHYTDNICTCNVFCDEKVMHTINNFAVRICEKQRENCAKSIPMERFNGQRPVYYSTIEDIMIAQQPKLLDEILNILEKQK